MQYKGSATAGKAMNNSVLLLNKTAKTAQNAMRC